MSEPGDGRVAVYIDFDNIVISRYDQVHGRGQYMRDRQKVAGEKPRPAFAAKLAEARVDLGAVIDFSSSFGTLVLTRAYADWSAAVNADYRGQLVGRAVDLVAGDSDYVPLAQRIKRLGRYVVGIGVAGSTARSLAAACDEFVSYDDLPGVARDEAAETVAAAAEAAAETADTPAEADRADAPRTRAASRST